MSKNILIMALGAAVLFSSCEKSDFLTSVKEEWQPVVTLNYEDSPVYKPQTKLVNTHISELKALYKSKPVVIEDDIVIGGRIISDDRSGNIYRSLYIQDVSGAIEVKVGKSSMYNDYKRGQMLYVDCKGLTLGNYSGMLQLGLEDPTGDYETAYIDIGYLIDTHIFRGDPNDIVIADPLEMSEADLRKALSGGMRSDYFGKYVTIKDLQYKNQVFALIYLDSNANKKLSSNRLFLSDQQWGIHTWALSKRQYLEYLNSGVWDSALIGNSSDQNYGTVADNKAQLIKNASAYSLSHYFQVGRTQIQVRSSGYARFADSLLGDDIESGDPITVTGILTLYNNEAQFTLLDLDGVKVQ